MSWPLSRKSFEKQSERKRRERQACIENLPEYSQPLTFKERQLLDYDIPTAVNLIRKGDFTPLELLRAYGKRAIEAQSLWNPLTEIAIADAERWSADPELPLKPLAGFPISLKDPIQIAGYDSTGGFGCLIGKTSSEDGALVRLLRDAGAVPFVKTNIPKTMMSIGSYNDIWGLTTNPNNPDFSPGGSSSGEGALIAFGGSRIGVGTDIAGSVRVPAHFCGIYSIRMTSWRFPCLGDSSTDASGFEGVPCVSSPMARSLADLRYFIEAVFAQKPWEYDYQLVPLPWRLSKLPAAPKIGIIRSLEFLPLTPVMTRAMNLTEAALKKSGYQVVEFQLPKTGIVYDDLANRLFVADNFQTIHRMMQYGERCDSLVSRVYNYSRLPYIFRKLWEGLLRLLGYDRLSTERSWIGDLDVSGYYDLVSERETLRRDFSDQWKKSGIDFLILPAGPSAAVPVNFPQSSHMCIYTDLWNLMDYPAGVLPVTRVEKSRDALPSDFNIGSLEHHAARALFSVYDAEKMNGLPVAVQIVGPRFCDEEVIAAMELVNASLSDSEVRFAPLAP